MLGVGISPLASFRFLESQLHGQRSQQEEELKALQQQLSQAISGYSSGARSQVSAVIAVTLGVQLSLIQHITLMLHLFQLVIHLRALYMYRTSVMLVCLHIKDLQELLEAREQECIRLRREVKELKDTVSLRRLLRQSKISSDLLKGHSTQPLLLSPEMLHLDPVTIFT